MSAKKILGFEHFSLQIRDIEKNCLLIKWCSIINSDYESILNLLRDKHKDFNVISMNVTIYGSHINLFFNSLWLCICYIVKFPCRISHTLAAIAVCQITAHRREDGCETYWNNNVTHYLYVSHRLIINLVLHRHVCLVFLPNPSIAISLLFESRIGNFPKTFLLVSWAKIQYTRDSEGPDLWINVD
jgi:hypothetical protein